MKSRNYILNQKPTKPKLEPKPIEDEFEEDIPMSREVGDEVEFTYLDNFLTGRVVAVKDPLTCLIEADGETYFERGQDITHLPESARCPHCGQFGFLCQANCIVHQRKPRKPYMPKSKDIINIADVLDIKPGDDDNPAWVNDIVRCVITDVKEGKGKGPVKAKLCLPDDESVSITGIFWKRKYDDVAELEGKLVQMTDGMIRSVYKPEKGPRIQQLAINAKTDIEVVGESAHADKPLPHSASPDRDTPKTASERPRTQANGHPVTARKAIFEKFRLLGLVNKAYQAMKEEYHLPEMSGGELSTFSTGVGISLARGESLPEHVFSDVKPETPAPSSYSEEALAKTPPKTWDADKPNSEPPKKANGSSWTNGLHKSGDKLGDMDLNRQLKYARWAIGLKNPPKDAATNAFYANVMLMMAEKRVEKSTRLLMQSILSDERYGVEYQDDDINGYFQSHVKKGLDDLNETQAMNFISDYDNMMEELLEFAAKNNPQTSEEDGAMPE